MGRFFGAGSEGLGDDVGLRAAGVGAEVAGGEVGAAIATAYGGSVSGRTFGSPAFAGGEAAPNDTVRSEVARHVVTVGCR